MGLEPNICQANSRCSFAFGTVPEARGFIPSFFRLKEYLLEKP
jgi:hypothetical protein